MPSNSSQTDISDDNQRYTPLSGSKSQVESPRYRCPVASCHQVWYRPTAIEQIPPCPIHDVQMVRDSKVH